MNEKLKRESILITRIESGCYDDRLDVVMSNSDRLHNYPVWKAANQRKLLVGKGHSLKLPSKKATRPKLPSWVSCGVCTPEQKPYVEQLGEVLAEINKHHPGIKMSLGNLPDSRFKVQTMMYARQPFATTTVGYPDHFIQFTAGKDVCGGDIYSVHISSAGFDTEGDYYDNLTEAKARLFEAMRDEQLCGNC